MLASKQYVSAYDILVYQTNLKPFNFSVHVFINLRINISTIN